MSSIYKLVLIKKENINKKRSILINTYINEKKFKWLTNYEILFNFGKSWYEINNEKKLFFKNEISLKNSIDLEPIIISKKELKEIIQNKCKEVANNYKIMISIFESILSWEININEVPKNNLISNYLKRKVWEFSFDKNYDLELWNWRKIELPIDNILSLENDKKITNSDFFEYSVFELTKILKETNFSKYELVIIRE